MNANSRQQPNDDRGDRRPRSARAHIPVLLYHSVSDSPAGRIAEFSLTPDDFKRQIDVIASDGREAVNVSELVRRLSAGASAATANLVCVTFDDGWADNLDAAGLLATAGIPATVYVTSGCLGDAGMLSRAGLRELAAVPGIEIGAHSVTHPRLDELPRREIDDEIRSSRADLERELASPVESFAYPHGAYDRRVREAVIAAGFTSAAAVKNALSHADDDRFAIARWTVLRGHGPERLSGILRGSGAPLAWRRERLSTRGYRAFRRMRRRAGMAENRA